MCAFCGKKTKIEFKSSIKKFELRPVRSTKPYLTAAEDVSARESLRGQEHRSLLM